MSLAIVYLLVFSAVALLVGLVLPPLIATGISGRPRSGAGVAAHPYSRFVSPEKLRQAQWTLALLAGGLCLAGMLALLGIRPWFMIGLFSTGVGWMAYQIPPLQIQRKIRLRQEVFSRQLVDLTVGLTNALRAGAAFPKALRYVARDLGGVAGEELHEVLQDNALNVDLIEALEQMGKRMSSEDLNLLITAVKLTLKQGGSLAEVLDKITTTIRERTEFQRKLATMTAQGRFEAIAVAAAPLVVFGILYAINPEIMAPLIHEKAGWIAIGVVIGLECIGFIWIKKILAIDV